MNTLTFLLLTQARFKVARYTLPGGKEINIICIITNIESYNIHLFHNAPF